MQRIKSFNRNLRKVGMGKSKIHGLGLIAKRLIKKGETICLIKGKIVDWHVKDKASALFGPNWIGISETVWIDPSDAGLYVNHSCKPSAGIKGKITLVAIKDIARGDEVTIDYSITECAEFWEMDCYCGSKRCRRKIGPIQTLPIKIYKEYLPYIPRFFQNIYEKNK